MPINVIHREIETDWKLWFQEIGILWKKKKMLDTEKRLKNIYVYR